MSRRLRCDLTGCTRYAGRAAKHAVQIAEQLLLESFLAEQHRLPARDTRIEPVQLALEPLDRLARRVRGLFGEEHAGRFGCGSEWSDGFGQPTAREADHGTPARV